MIRLPNLIGTSHIIWFEAILPPGVDVMYDPFRVNKIQAHFCTNEAM